MKYPRVAENVVPIGEFKTHASALIRRMRATGYPLVVTQNGRAAAVLVPPEDFDAAGYREHVRAKIRAGLAQADGPTFTTEQVRAGAKARARGAKKG